MENLEQKKKKFSITPDVIIGVVALLTGLMHLLNTAGVITMSSVTLRVVHLAAMISILLVSSSKNGKYKKPYDIVVRCVLLVVVLFCAGYALLVTWPKMVSSGGSASFNDAVVGIIMVVAMLVICRRYLATSLAIVAVVFLIYPFVCDLLPGFLQGRTYSFTRTFNMLFSSTNGLYGIPLGVSSTYIVIFCIFGAFLSSFGVSDFMFKLSAAITRGMVGATAKTAVVFSLLIGMITGSPAGNVAITGSITIPLMKSRGYLKEKAAAFESVASTGGPLMPPVMGSAAFLMAELTGIRYASIMKAALLPALLYFMSIMFVAHFDCKKNNVDCKHEPSPDDQTVWQVIKEGWYNALPLVLLIVLLVVGFSPLKSAFFSIVSLLVLYIVKTRKINGKLFLDISKAIQKGVTDASTMAVACATSGIIVGVMTMTGLGSRLSTLIVSISQGNVMAALALVMVTAIVLGMGLPTSPAYLVLATVAVPALMDMQLPQLASHLFVFFFAAISAITPPVALASYVAAGIADADLNKVGFIAFRWGIAAFILPFMFIQSPALMLDGTVLEVVRVVVMGLLGVFTLGVSLVGFFKANMPMWQRILLFIFGVLLIDTGLITDIVGIIGAAAICFVNFRKYKKTEVAKA